MNGPEHYREAERLIDSTQAAQGTDRLAFLAEAQIHAVLALVAALQPHGRSWAVVTRYDGAARS